MAGFEMSRDDRVALRDKTFSGKTIKEVCANCGWYLSAYKRCGVGGEVYSKCPASNPGDTCGAFEITPAIYQPRVGEGAMVKGEKRKRKKK